MASQDLSLSKPGVSSFLWAIAILFLAALVALLVFHLFRRSNAHDAERANARYENLRKLNEDHAAKAQKYAWLDKGKGVVQIPISEAMHVMTRELAAKKPASAYPIATPAAAAAAPAAANPPIAGSVAPTAVAKPAANLGNPSSASSEVGPSVSIPAQSPTPVPAPIQNAAAPTEGNSSASPAATTPAVESAAPAPAITPSSTPAPTP